MKRCFRRSRLAVPRKARGRPRSAAGAPFATEEARRPGFPAGNRRILPPACRAWPGWPETRESFRARPRECRRARLGGLRRDWTSRWRSLHRRPTRPPVALAGRARRECWRSPNRRARRTRARESLPAFRTKLPRKLPKKTPGNSPGKPANLPPPPPPVPAEARKRWPGQAGPPNRPPDAAAPKHSKTKARRTPNRVKAKAHPSQARGCRRELSFAGLRALAVRPVARR